jgi:hypothetical protein
LTIASSYLQVTDVIGRGYDKRSNERESTGLLFRYKNKIVCGGSELPNGQLRSAKRKDSSGGQESLPKLRGDLDSGRAPNWVRFLIKDGSIMLTKAYPEFHVSEVADWSDEKLRQKLEVVTGGLVRKAA